MGPPHTHQGKRPTHLSLHRQPASDWLLYSLSVLVVERITYIKVIMYLSPSVLIYETYLVFFFTFNWVLVGVKGHFCNVASPIEVSSVEINIVLLLCVFLLLYFFTRISREHILLWRCCKDIMRFGLESHDLSWEDFPQRLNILEIYDWNSIFIYLFIINVNTINSQQVVI